MVKINGKLLDVKGMTVADCISSAGYDIKRIAVELNGDILPKNQYEITILKDEDSMEIVSFMGGG